MHIYKLFGLFLFFVFCLLIFSSGIFLYSDALYYQEQKPIIHQIEHDEMNWRD